MNKFELAGVVENITDDTIDLNVEGESLEVVAAGLLPQLVSAQWLSVGQHILVRGKITASHLKAESVYILGRSF